MKSTPLSKIDPALGHFPSRLFRGVQDDCFCLPGGLSGAKVLLIQTTAAPLVLKVGPPKQIAQELRTFLQLRGTNLFTQLALGSEQDAWLSSLRFRDGSRALGYRFLGQIPRHSEQSVGTLLDSAESYINGTEDRFPDHIANISGQLLELRAQTSRQLTSILLPEYTEPAWQRVDPLLATAQAFSSRVPTVDAIHTAWNRWESRRSAPVQMQLGFIHGDLRAANVVLAWSARTTLPFLVDFGSVKRAPSYVDLVRLEIDLILRMQVSDDLFERILVAAFDPQSWTLDSNASATDRVSGFVGVFRQAYLGHVGTRHAASDICDDYYAFYLSELLRRVPYWEVRFLEPKSRRTLWWLVLLALQRLRDSAAFRCPTSDSVHSYVNALKSPEIPPELGVSQVFFGPSDSDARDGRTLSHLRSTVMLNM
jgi:hypothetical protein